MLALPELCRLKRIDYRYWWRSMELIYVDDGQAEEIISLPIGAVLLSQEYHLDDQINSADLFDAIVRLITRWDLSTGCSGPDTKKSWPWVAAIELWLRSIAGSWRLRAKVVNPFMV